MERSDHRSEDYFWFLVLALARTGYRWDAAPRYASMDFYGILIFYICIKPLTEKDPVQILSLNLLQS